MTNQQNKEITTDLADLKEEFYQFRANVEAKAQYEILAKQEAEKRFNRNITIAGILVTLFGVILPILIQILILILSRDSN